MSQFFGYNPERGTWYEDDWDHDKNEFVLHTKQDVEPVLDYAKMHRNSGRHDKVGNFCYYATIPASVELELRQKGIDINNKHQTKELLQTINRDYPHLKVTQLTHE